METVQVIDVIVLTVIAVAAMVGLAKGLVRQVIELVGIVAAFILAMVFAGWLAETLRLHTPLRYSPSMVVAFVLLLAGGIIASHFIARMVQRLIRMTFLGWFDRLCGAALGVLVGAVLTSLVVSVVLELPIPARTRGDIQSSDVCRTVQPIAPAIFNFVFARIDGLNYDDIFRRAGDV